MSVRIIQVLCPNRHAIVGLAYEGDEPDADVMRTQRELVALAIKHRMLNPWCGLCHAPASQWKYEDAKSVFRTLKEAEPQLRAGERAQMATSQMIERSRN